MLLNKYIPVIVAAFSILYIGCTSGNGKQSAVNKPVTEKVSKIILPDLPLSDMAGNPLNLKDFQGKMIFVNLWASWCPPCRAEMPSIQKLSDKVTGKNVQFVMLALDDNFTKSLKYLSSSKLSLPAFYPAASLPSLFNVQGIPATFIFNTKGELIKRIEGGDNYDSPEYIKLLSQ